MIVIKGTDKIKGILDLGDIGLQLKTGDTYSLTEEKFYKHGVQIALKMELITYSHNSVPDPDSETIVQLRNIFDRSIAINAIESEVRPGQTFGLSEDIVNTPDIQGALAKGMLEVVSSGRSFDSDEETEVKVGGLFEEEKPGPIPPMHKTISIPRGLDIPEIPDIPDALETNEELSVHNIVDEENPPPIRKSDIPDPKGKTVVWNPNKDPIPHTQSQMDNVDARTGEIGNHSPIAETDLNISEEISFVDSEMDSKKRESHPILKDVEEKSNDGLDFV